MNTSVDEPVYFHVIVNTVERDGHWVAKTLETAIFGYGDTPEEAAASAADANALIVRELKLQGMTALKAFMKKYGIAYSLGKPSGPKGQCPESAQRLMRAA